MFKKMATSKATEFLSGKFYWAKVTGNPVPNYGGDAREWTFEFAPDAPSVAKLKKHGLLDRLKTKDDPKNPDKGKFLVLRKKEFSSTGDKNQPIRIYNADDEAWDGSLIGNGSAGDVKLDIRDYGPGKKKGVYPVAIRITDHVVYQSSEFGAMDKVDGFEDDEPKPRRKAKGFDEDLDDDIPF